LRAAPLSWAHRTVMRGPASEHLKWRKRANAFRGRRSARDARPAPAARRHARARARSHGGRHTQLRHRRVGRAAAAWLHARIGARCPMHPVGASHSCSACLPRAIGSIFGMNSGATQRAVELAAADPANRAQLGRRRELGERRRPKKLPRRAAFEHEPESAAARGVSGARGTTRCAARPPGDAQR
jgi:hypothetical protein